LSHYRALSAAKQLLDKPVAYYALIWIYLRPLEVQFNTLGRGWWLYCGGRAPPVVSVILITATTTAARCR